MNKLEQVYKIHEELYQLRKEGCIIPDKVFEVLRNEVEEFMQTQYALEHPEKLDDDMPDHFNVWLIEKMEQDDLLAKILN